MRTTSILSFILPALCLVACGSSDDGDGDGTDAAVADAATTAPDADPNAPDAAVGLQCGDETCDDTQECCVTGAGQSTCVEAETCQGTSFSCGNAEDCGEDELCCPVAGGGSECQMTTSCSIPQCTTEADCPTQGHDCCTIGTTQVCAPNCPGNN
jgi:hypothetical protein